MDIGWRSYEGTLSAHGNPGRCAGDTAGERRVWPGAADHLSDCAGNLGVVSPEPDEGQRRLREDLLLRTGRARVRRRALGDVRPVREDAGRHVSGGAPRTESEWIVDAADPRRVQRTMLRAERHRLQRRRGTPAR